MNKTIKFNIKKVEYVVLEKLMHRLMRSVVLVKRADNTLHLRSSYTEDAIIHRPMEEMIDIIENEKYQDFIDILVESGVTDGEITRVFTRKISR